MLKKYAFPTFRHLLLAILLSFPVVLLILPTGRRFSFYLLLLCALVCVVCRTKLDGKSVLYVLKTYWQINLAMAGVLIAVLLHQLAWGEFVFKPVEKSLQLAVFPLFVWVLLRLSANDLRILQWTCIIGGVLGSAALYWATQGGSERPLGVISNPIIPFSNLTLLMGFMALLSAGWNERDKVGMITLKILVSCACLYAAYISGTRGGWIAIPFFIMIAVSLKKGIGNRRKILVSLASTILVAAVMACLPYTKNRMELVYSETISYAQQSDAETSVGIRLQLWAASWDMFRNNPFVGIGIAQYEQKIKALAKEGALTPQAGLQAHAHNDVLRFLAALGVVGGIAIFALYLAPCLWFVKLARSPDTQQRVTAGMGLAVCVGFFAFGLTDSMFYWNLGSDFYTISLAALFALCIKRQEELASESEVFQFIGTSSQANQMR